MPSIASLGTLAFTGAGAAAGGMLGYRHAKDREDFDTADKLGFTASSAIAGAASGLALRYIGLGRAANGLGMAAKGARKGAGLLMANPGKAMMRKMGRTEFGINAIPKRVRGLAAIGLTAVAGVAAIAYSSRSNPPTTAYASDDQAGGVAYDQAPPTQGMTMREKMGMIGASGDMVFGLNNSRHG